MSNKTTRKNRTNLTLKWPDSEYFTVNELFDANPEFIRITLRVRLKKEIDEAKAVAVIGSKKGSHGRPALVYTMTPVSQETIDKARTDGIDIVGDNDLVKVLEITPVNETMVSPEMPPTPVQSTSSNPVVAAH